jgi:hypothetical protein
MPPALIVPRLGGALLLRPSTYAAVAADASAGLQCAIVVLISAIFEAASSAALHGAAVLDSREILPAMIAAPIGWLIWGVILWLVGVRALAHSADFGAVMRALGLAHAPGLILGIALLPGLAILTGTLYLVALAWFVAAMVAAASGALRVPPRRAILVVAIALAAHETLRQGLRLFGLQA